MTRLKVAPQGGGDAARSEAEHQRGLEFAKAIAMPHLARAWQMLLKGLKEVEYHVDPLMARRKWC